MIGLTMKEKEQAYLAAEDMIWNVAWTYSNRGLSIDDLFQYGALGFMKACNRFNKGLGIKVTTYAYPFVKYEMLEALNLNNNFIHIPQSHIRRYKALNKMIDENLGVADYTAIQDKLGLDYHKVIEILTDVPTVIRVEEYEMHQDNAYDPSELHEIESKEEGLLDFIKDKLTDKQYEVVLLRHGFITGQVETFIEIGKRLDISPQAARMLFERAEERLREYKEEIRLYA